VGAIGTRIGGSTRLGHWLLRHRVIVMAVVAFAVGATASRAADFEDDVLFLYAGNQLVHGHLDQVFNDAGVQVGPLYLLVAGALQALCRLLHLNVRIVLAGAGAATATALLALVTRRMLTACRPGTADAATREACVLVAVVLGGPLVLTSMFGHAEELVVALTVVLAALAAHRRSPWAAGALLGVAGCVKLWGLLAGALVLLLPTLLQRLRAIAVAAFVLGVAYVPFFVTKAVATFTYAWLVFPQSPMSLAIRPTTHMGWVFRLLQGGIVIAVCLVTLRAVGRESPWRSWAIPVAAVATRILTDPMLIVYYWSALLTLLAIGVAVAAGRSPRPLVARVLTVIPIATLVAEAPLLLQPATHLTNRAFAVGNAVGTIAVILYAVWTARRLRQPGGTALVGEPFTVIAAARQ
jgi:hypothetical protein